MESIASSSIVTPLPSLSVGVGSVVELEIAAGFNVGLRFGEGTDEDPAIAEILTVALTIGWGTEPPDMTVSSNVVSSVGDGTEPDESIAEGVSVVPLPSDTDGEGTLPLLLIADGVSVLSRLGDGTELEASIVAVSVTSACGVGTEPEAAIALGEIVVSTVYVTCSWIDENRQVGLLSVEFIPNACSAFTPTPFTSSTVQAADVFGFVAQLSSREV